MEMTDLRPARDERAVRAWLDAHVRDHLRAWTAAVADPWDDARIAEHVASHDLVEREWKDVVWAAAHAPRGHVQVARSKGRAVGVLWAEERLDRFLCRPVAALCWVFVTPAWRGRGVAGRLVDGYDAWAATRPVVAREVYVTATNEPAMRLYRSRGLAVSDHRMFAPGTFAPGAAALAAARDLTEEASA